MTTTITNPEPPGVTRLEPEGRARGRLRGSAGADDPGGPATWYRPALAVLLLATAALYLWDLSASGWANSFYSAAVQAGAESWKAFFFGSSDAANSITVDKTPLALWPMALSVKVFGLSSWSILAPQALEGVASVALLTRLVRRTTNSEVAGLIAGAVLALTPVAVLMFRFNNPDALLTLLLVAATGATLRAVGESSNATGRPLRWLVLGGGLVGLAFLTKMLQAFLVLPALAVVYLIFARTPIGRRFGHLVAAFGAMVVAGGWWVAIVQLWPAASRPYIGGSQNNSILELTLGYNGFGRLSGNETGSVGGGAGGRAGGWGATGIGRLFNTEIGGQIAWLLPAALVLGAAAAWFARRGGANRPVRAAVAVWGLTLLITGLTFSFMAGIFHAYYTVAMAPSIAALVGIGGMVLWRERRTLAARIVLALTVAGTTVLAVVLLDRSSDFVPWLRVVVVVLGTIATGRILVLDRLRGRWAAAVAVVALAGTLAGPAAYAIDTATTPHTGSIPTAGPTIAGAQNGPGGGPGGRFGPPGQFPMGGPGGANGPATGQFPPGVTGTGAAGGGGARAGGLLTSSTSSTAITGLLKVDATRYTWVAAAVGSNTAAGYQLASQLPVMAIGGFNGSDPSPTLAQFQAWVAAGKVHYFIAGGNGGPGGGPGGATGSTSSSITAWVEAHFSAKTVDGITLYDLSGGAR